VTERPPYHYRDRKPRPRIAKRISVSETELATALDGLIFDLPIGDDVNYSRGYSAAVAALRDGLRHDLWAALVAAQEKGETGS
jgi:hypothetical protein